MKKLTNAQPSNVNPDLTEKFIRLCKESGISQTRITAYLIVDLMASINSSYQLESWLDAMAMDHGDLKTSRGKNK